MEIQYKQGCLIEAFRTGEVKAIAHQANCQNTMKSGVAKALVEWCPAIAEADQATRKGDLDKLGTLTFTPAVQDLYRSPTRDVKIGLVFNLYGQFYYGREKGVIYTDLKALGNAMGQMKMFLDVQGIKDVGLPKLGAGLGGAKWEDVERVILAELDGLNVTIYSK
jgi:O-acetyl-ADP-ribose deacetylase (regulator of RNase III)